jgi:cytochrome o ubiquinol oxidase subunit 2
MSGKNKKRHSRIRLRWVMPLAALGFVILLAFLMHGKNIALFNTKGLIAHEQLRLIVFTLALLLSVAVPTIFLLYFTAWRFRETNSKAVHDPTPIHSKFILSVMWLVPIAFLVILTAVMFPATHRLEPNKQIAADSTPLTIQVVSMRWKWVFFYPEQQIATVNYVQLPVNTPVTFELTGDEAPMSSFWIPNLGGQLYSMTSHVNRLNLIAETPGDYPGSSAELNGAGFSGMKFTTRASSKQDFDNWVKEVKQSGNILDTASYDHLLKPSENNPATYYAAFDDNLYDRAVMKYMGSHESHADQTNHEHHE